METEGDLLVRILSLFVNIKKYTRYICTQRLWTLCVTSRIIMKSQAASSIAIVNYSKILPLKYTTMEGFNKYSKNDKKNLKYFSGLNFLNT